MPGTTASRVRDRPAVCSFALGALCVVLCALGCAGAGSQSRARQPSARRDSDELEMRKPGARAAGIAKLGSLEPVPVAARPDPRAQPAASVTPAEQPPMRVARVQSPRPYPLRNGALVLPGGLIIHHVPENVVVYTVLEQNSRDNVLELVDPRGRRIALLKETAVSSVAMPSGAPLLGATAATHSQATREDWATSPVAVVVDRFSSETHLYTLERRAQGTDWIWAGLELSPSGGGGSER